MINVVERGNYFIPELIAYKKAQGKYTDYICYDKLEAHNSFGGIRIEDDFAVTDKGYQKLGEPFSYHPAPLKNVRWRRKRKTNELKLGFVL